MSVACINTWLLPTNSEHGHTSYQLSDADYIPGPNCTQRLIIYKNRENNPNFMPTKALIEGLQKALEHYPILYGKLVRLEDTRMEVQSSSKGILFSEAQSQDGISKFEPDWPHISIPSEWQAIEPWATNDLPLFAVRVTRFANNSGLVLCTACHHRIADGVGWLQFLNAWATLVRGGNPSPPNHDRGIMCGKPATNESSKRTFPPPDDQSIYRHEVDTKQVIILQFSADKLVQLKQVAMEALTDEERTTKWVSTIDVILMLLWRVSVRIRDLPKDKLIGVFSPLNMRFFWRDFPNNYFGNVFHATSLILPAGRVIKGSLGDLATSYRQSVNASKQDSKECVLGLSDNDTSTSLVNKDANWLSYIDFSSTDWTKLGYYDMNFGYGAPIRYRRYMYPIMPSATIYDTPVDPVTLKRNIEVCIPVDKRHYDRFINDEELTTYARLIG